MNLVNFLANTPGNYADPILNGIGGSFAEALSTISIWSILTRLLLALIFAGVIGLERASKKHAAGLRTYILVCLGSTAVTMANQFMLSYGNADAARLGLGVVQGVGFLGAGTILVTSRNQIKGLTTAAGLWANACLGICIGCGFYTAALIMFVIILFVLLFLPRIEKAYTQKKGIIEIHIEFETRANLKTFVQLIREQKLRVASVEHNPAYSNSGLSVYTVVVIMKRGCQYKTHKELVNMIAGLDYVEYVEEI